MSAIDQIPDQKVRAVLHRLHDEAGHEVWKILWKYLPYYFKLFSGKKLPWERLQYKHDRDYLASTPGHGMYLYLLARAIDAKRIVEFGTSFGVSTIYLALAVRDNGGGLVIGTEMIPSKAARARSNIEEAGPVQLRGNPRGKCPGDSPRPPRTRGLSVERWISSIRIARASARRAENATWRHRCQSQRGSHERRSCRVCCICPRSGQWLRVK